jgi:uncharacterized repeat protein (TIGR01451 family)
MSKPIPPMRGLVVLACALAAAVAAIPASAVSPNIVISQVYGGGGNSGATYKNDFIELFNRGSSSVDVTGWSVQYASASGTTWSVTNLSSYTIQPGQYYLVQEAAGSGGTTNLPAPDATGSIAMSATSGKVALVSNQTALTCGGSPCTCFPNASIVDFVGYGTTACYEGSGAAPTLSNTTAALRALSGCTDTDDNSSDFSSGAPNPRNTSSPFNVCAASTSPSGTGSAQPATLVAGDGTTLLVSVTPGTNPASTGLTVTCDATAISGSATQTLYDDGTNGDATPGDNTFSYATTVPVATSNGDKDLPCTIGDAQLRSGNATITLHVVTLTKIHDIQGSGNSSPLAGNVVTTRGIVTALLSSSFYIEEPDAGWDADPNTSEGISVYKAPAGVARGDMVTVTGTVQEYSPASEPLQPTTTELASVTDVSVVSSGNTLPTPVTISATDTDPAGGFYQLEKYEAMRATFAPSMTVVGPTGGTVDEVNATATSSGWFWGVVTGVVRPFREKGANTLDNNVFGTPPGACTGSCNPTQVPRFDGNPERFDIGTKSQTGGTALDVRTGDVLTGLVGIVSFTTSAGYRSWQFFPDPGTGTVSTPGPGAAPVPAANSREFTVATFNMERFFDTTDDHEPVNGPVLTATAFQNRLDKASLAIRNYLLMPDILAVEEVENIGTLTSIANQVNTDAGGSSPQYVPYLVEGNDVGGIDVGFLVRTAEVAAGVPRVSVGSVVQENAGELFTNPDTSTELLNDRPPLRLMATVHHANGSSFPLTVIVVHQKALSSIDSQSPGSNGWSTVGARNRAKRQAQARSLATLVNARQAADPTERIVVLGDVNAFEFNDGYVDVMNITTGASPQTLDAEAILGNGGAIYTTPPLVDLISTASAQRYSYSDYGSAQNLDHLMVNAALQTDTLAQRLEHARIDADFPEVDRNDPNTARRLSDHDPLVGFFEVPAFATADVSVAISGAPAQAPPGADFSYTVTVTNAGPDAADPVTLTDVLPAGTTFQALVSPGGWGCTTPAVGANGTISCSIDPMPVGSAVFTVTLRIDAGTPLGTLFTHDVTISASGSTDPAPGNDEDQATTTAAAGPAANIAATGGTPQYTVINTPFLHPLEATVTDSFANPVAGIDVTFTAPASGASGTFPGASLTATVATDANGVATSPTFTANGVKGDYTVSATAPGVTGSAAFALSNGVEQPIPALGGGGILLLILLLAGAAVALLARTRP